MSKKEDSLVSVFRCRVSRALMQIQMQTFPEKLTEERRSKADSNKAAEQQIQISGNEDRGVTEYTHVQQSGGREVMMTCSWRRKGKLGRGRMEEESN